MYVYRLEDKLSPRFLDWDIDYRYRLKPTQLVSKITRREI